VRPRPNDGAAMTRRPTDLYRLRVYDDKGNCFRTK
jgi:hypothetical protein